MSFDTLIPEIWTARLQSKLRERVVWLPLVWDMSSELAADGDTVHIEELVGTVTIGDYNPDEDMGDPQELDSAESLLVVDQKKYWQMMVTDIDKVQARPSLIDKHAELAAKDSAVYIQNFIRSKHVATGSDVIEIPSTEKDYDTAEKRAKITDAFLDMSESLDDANVPEEGRYAVVSPKIAKYLLKTVEDRGLSLESERTMARRAYLLDIWGFHVYKDAGAAGEAIPTIRMGLTGNDLLWAQQIQKTEALRHQKRFNDILRGLLVYGMIPNRPDLEYMRQIKLLQA